MGQRLFNAITLHFLAVVLVLMASVSARACQDGVFGPLGTSADDAIAVFRARVIERKVLHLDELDIPCQESEHTVQCKVLEVTLAIHEDFKGNASSYSTVYAPIAPFCGIPVVPTIEYVFFLEDNGGLAEPGLASFRVGDEGSENLMSELRAWKARNLKQ